MRYSIFLHDIFRIHYLKKVAAETQNLRLNVGFQPENFGIDGHKDFQGRGHSVIFTYLVFLIDRKSQFSVIIIYKKKDNFYGK